MLGSFRAAVAKARRDRSLLFAALFRREYSRSLRSCKMALARLDLFSGCNRLGLPFPMLEHGSFLPRRGGAVDCLARGERFASLFGGHGRLLHRPRRPSRSGLPPTDLPDREGLGAPTLPPSGCGTSGTCAWSTAPRSRCRTRQPTRPSIPRWRPKSRAAVFPSRDRRRVLAGDGDGARSGPRELRRQADRREQPVPHAPRLSGSWRRRAV